MHVQRRHERKINDDDEMIGTKCLNSDSDNHNETDADASNRNYDGMRRHKRSVYKTVFAGQITSIDFK